jgi:hypothetical protein
VFVPLITVLESSNFKRFVMFLRSTIVGLTGTYQVLVYADVNMLGKNTEEALLITSKEVGLEVGSGEI